MPGPWASRRSPFNGELHDDVAATLAAYGAQTLYRPSAADLDDYLVGPKASYLAAAVQTAGATVVLTENSAEAKEIAARLGIKLGAGVITDVVAVDPDGTAHKSVLAGSYTTTAKATTPGRGPDRQVQQHHPGTRRHRHGAGDRHRGGAGDGHRGLGPDHGPQREGRQRPPGPRRGADCRGRRPRRRRELRPASKTLPMPSVPPSAPPAPPPTPAGSATTRRSARPARPCPPSSTSPPASPGPSSRRPACRPPR